MKTPSSKAKKNGGPVFPYQFTKNGRTGKIYQCKDGKFATKFTFAGKRIPNTHASFANAVEYLEREFVKLDDDRANALSLNPLNGDVRNYAELEHLLRQEGGGASLREAVSFFLANYKHKRFVPQSFDYCFTSFKAAKKLDNDTDLYLKSLSKHCGRFAKDFGARLIHEITALEITAWLSSQKDEKSGKLWSTKTRTNVRGSLVSLSLYCQSILKAIPDMGLTEFQKVNIPKPDKQKAVEIYSPDEIRQLLLTAIEEDISLIPVIAIGSFAGLRPFEIHAEGKEGEREPLNWEAFNWGDNLLHVGGQKVRSIATRDVPLAENLKAWLAPFTKPSGALWKFKQAHTKKLIALRGKAGVRSVYDGFRHSYASYRIRQLKQDLAQLAGEMGNSPGEIVGHYKRNVTDGEAAKWFAVMPPAGYAEKVKALLELQGQPQED